MGIHKEKSTFTMGVGMKANKGKSIWSLVPFKGLERAVKVLEHGAIKYAPGNWEKVNRADYIDAVFRHLIAFISGEAKDSETGCSHLDHALCNLLFLTVLYGDDGFEPHSKEHIKELLGFADENKESVLERPFYKLSFKRGCFCGTHNDVFKQGKCYGYRPCSIETNSGCFWLCAGGECFCPIEVELSTVLSNLDKS